MAIKSCENVTLTINSVDMSDVTDEVTVEMDMGVITYRDLAECSVKKEPTYPANSIEHKGYYNGPDAGELEGEISAALGVEEASAVTVAVAITEGGTTKTYTITNAMATNLVVESTSDNLLMVSATWRPTDGVMSRA
jgi:hypothetical protein